VDNIHAFVFVLPLYGYYTHTEGIEHFDATQTQLRTITENAENPMKSRQN